MKPNPVHGYLGALTAVLCFGSYAVPVKSFPTGDGFVFQWVECCGILVVGFIIEVIIGAPYRFEPLGMLGGVFWCLGNATVIPVVDCIGMGLGLLIWGACNMIIGWSAGHFGIFVDKEQVAHPALNYLGVAIAVMSIFLYLPIKATVSKKGGDEEVPHEKQSLVNYTEAETEVSAPAPTSGLHKKIIGVLLSVVAGFFYAANMIPISYLQQRHPDAHPLAFALSHFSGIFLTSTAMLIGYCIYKKNRPQFFAQSFLPSLLTGAIWACGQAGWFIGNPNLGLTTAFPIICTGPGIIGSLWSVLVFKEIQGLRNLLFLGAAFTVTVTGVLFIAFSH